MESTKRVNPIELYTDGSANPNPGTGGLGYIIRYWYEDNGNIYVNENQGSKGFRKSTNNRMEIMAAIVGLLDIKVNIDDGTFKNVYQINVYSDSKYLVDAITKKWVESWMRRGWVTYNKTPVKNRDLWEQMMAVLAEYKRISVSVWFEHVDGHSGLLWNDQVDELASKAARDSSKHVVDETYEKGTYS
jgi:ribonuclease HI